ncbi:glycoside hydrolase family 19 protein [Variovorax ureilyticus]|uniref:glycoside hydrolase family 19 protein n=1 Tax=Variovorax ureilyticus TaxID=1836198 RepID=UPI003D6701DA
MDAATLARCTGARLDRAQLLVGAISAAMADYDISTPQRQGMFLANVGHETTHLMFLAELGSKDYLMRYEGRADLGNTQLGDGPRYKGRGILQTTGRANYRALTRRLRAKGIDCPDFEAEPERLELPQWAALSAGDYVDMRKLNAKADAADFLGYCIGINGKNKETGLPNGWGERTDLWVAAQKALVVTDAQAKGADSMWGNEIRR